MVVGGDTLPTRKPDPAADAPSSRGSWACRSPLSSWWATAASTPRPPDAAGARLALAGWGYGGAELRGAECEILAASVADLARALDAVLSAGILPGSDA